MVLVLAFLPVLLTLVDNRIFRDRQRFDARMERLSIWLGKKREDLHIQHGRDKAAAEE